MRTNVEMRYYTSCHSVSLECTVFFFFFSLRTDKKCLGHISLHGHGVFFVCAFLNVLSPESSKM